MNQPTPAQSSLQRLLDIIAQLRGPNGCPWDRAQTKQSLRPYLLEETYEVLDAIDNDGAAELCSELGDLLLQIVLLARLHEEQAVFDFADVCTAIGDKMIRRHPHVFAKPSRQLSAIELDRQWQRIKNEESGGEKQSRPANPPPLPALLLAQRISPPLPSAASAVETTLRSHLESYLHSLKEPPVEPAEEALAELLLALAQSAATHEINAELALRRRVLLGLNSSQSEKS